MRRRNSCETKLLFTMRNLVAKGWNSEALIVDTAAETIGGSEDAKLQAQLVYDKHFKIMEAN